MQCAAMDDVMHASCRPCDLCPEKMVARIRWTRCDTRATIAPQRQRGDTRMRLALCGPLGAMIAVATLIAPTAKAACSYEA